jgi:hypothetical protein
LKTLANRPVLAARRLLRSLRGPLSDKLIMLVASLIYAGKVDRAFIEERLGYMYFVPFRYADFSAKLEARGLRLVAETVATGALDTSLVFRYGPILSSVVAVDGSSGRR